MKTPWAVGILAVLLLVVGIYYFTRDTDMPPVAQNEDVVTPATENENESAGNPSTAASANQNTVLGVLNARPELSVFASYVNRSSSKTGLGTAGQNFTVFAPTNGAIALLQRGTISNLSQTDLNELIRNHLIAKRIDVRGIETGYMETMAGHKVTVDIQDQNDAVLVGSGFVINSYTTGNGVVYVISSVLLTPEE